MQKAFTLVLPYLFILFLFPLPEEIYPQIIDKTDAKDNTAYIFF